MAEEELKLGQYVRIKKQEWDGSMVYTRYSGRIIEHTILPTGTEMWRVRLNNFATNWFYTNELEVI